MFPPPNGPELSCGGELPVTCSSVRGRSKINFRSGEMPRGEIVHGTFPQLVERFMRDPPFVGGSDSYVD